MMLLIALQAAVVVATPPVRDVRTPLVAIGDYPTQSLAAGEFGLVTIVASITPEGRADRCAVTETSGFARLDAATCRVISRRGRFTPARDASGAAVRGDYRTVLSWGVEQHMPTANMALELGVLAVPATYAKPVKAHVLFDAEGRPGDCRIEQSSGNAAADAAACATIHKEVRIKPPKSFSGTPAALRIVTVTLVKSAQPR